jgi:choline dehydrogenase
VAEETWEYIVVGSGAGGGPVAANLARAGYRVLLLEAGGSPNTWNYDVPAFHPNASEEPDMSWAFYVRHYTDQAQQERDTKFVSEKNGVFYPRAGTLGGCTAHNAMVFLYPSDSDWNCIADMMHDDSWRARKMRRYFERLERCDYRPFQRFIQRLLGWNPSRHGFDGWLANNQSDPKLMEEDDELERIVIDSTLKVLFGNFSIKRVFNRIVTGLLTKLDPNSWWLVRKNAEGLRLTPITVNGRNRTSSRERLLDTMKEFPDKLTIRTGALATRVLFDEQMRAVGVEYLEGEHLYRADPRHDPGKPGVPRQVRATREVILAGGAFNSPQLLQLSGIGPADLLKEHGIPVLVNLPGVGKNLQDRYETSVVLEMKKPFKILEGATLAPPKPGQPVDPQFEQWLQGKGVYATNGSVVAIIKKSVPARPVPDLYIFGLLTNFYGYFPGYSKVIQAAHSYFTWAILKAHTNNTAGLVAITSNDPRDVPSINFHYFNEGNDTSGDDLESVVKGIQYTRQIVQGYADLVEEETRPGKDVQTVDQIREYVRDEAWGHHASCTCAMGPRSDPKAVLDTNFRVYGTKGLRVVDASAFPRIPGMFVVSAIYMMAEKASDVILADAKRGSAGDQGKKPMSNDDDSSKSKRRGCLLWGLAILLLLAVIWLICHFTADRPVQYSSDTDHFKYGSIGSEPGGSLFNTLGGLLPPEPIFRVLPKICWDKLPGGYASLGLISEKGHDLPIGVSQRFRLGLNQVGLNCAVCHTGTVRATPQSPPQVILGMPSHQVALQDFFRFVIDCTLDQRFTADNLLGTMEKEGIELSAFDKVLYRVAVVSQTRETTLKLQQQLQRLLGTELTEWGRGRVDTFNPYKGLQFNWQLANLPAAEVTASSDFPSIWNQAPREKAKMHLHWDGNNDSVDERNRSASLGAGVTPVTLDYDNLNRVKDWIMGLPPPRYPFAIDQARAARGREVYRAQCQYCHADDQFKNGIINDAPRVGQVENIRDIGTDPYRVNSYTYVFSLNQYQLYPNSKFRFTHFRKTGGYSNHPLDGIWARAPYLHNGSVPTLRDLLDPPEARPKGFYRGYDVFDQQKVGFLTNVAKANGMDFTWFDTSQPANSNGGHVYGVGLSSEDKDAIVEYMKMF